MLEATAQAHANSLKGLCGPQTSQPDRSRLLAALQLATEVHGQQRRPSGETYLDHARAVAAGLNELGVEDLDTLIAALLHDALLPHTGLKEETLGAKVGGAVVALVKSAWTLDSYAKRASRSKSIDQLGLDAPPDRHTLEAIRRALIVIIEGDIRSILIRMVDCLQELRRADALAPDVQRRIASEALHIYAPIANRLGIWHLKWQLEDLAFRFLDPDKYHEIAIRLDEGRESRTLRVEKAAARLRRKLTRLGIRAVVTGRPKHMYSIYRKMARKGLKFNEIHDVQALRVILEPLDKAAYDALSSKGKDEMDRALCYQVLGAVHSLWQPLRGEFDDYIGMPKPNGYRSLHTAVLDTETGQKLEVQIRTQRMHEEAEHGVAAHWAYKEQGGTKVNVTSQKRIQDLRELLAALQEVEEAPDDVPLPDISKWDERIHVFTPRDDVLDLPVGATPIDFAYQIHTEVGHRCRGARVNGKMVSLSYRLKSGDRVEIITANRGGPNRNWMNPSLGYTGSARTRSKIRQWFRQQEREQNILQGREVVERELKRLFLDGVITVEQVAETLKYDSVEDFLCLVGFGDIQPPRIAGALVLRQQQLRSERQDAPPPVQPPTTRNKGLTIRGVSGLHTRFGACCSPVPPQPITGYITRGQGVTVHRSDCPQLKGISEPERLIEVEWGTEVEQHPIPLVIKASRRPGLMEEVHGLLRGADKKPVKTKIANDGDQTTIYLIVEVSNLTQLDGLINQLKQLRGVGEVLNERWR